MDIELLKKFFTISVAAFDFAATRQQSFSKYPVLPTQMQILHRMMLTELEAEIPNENVITRLLDMIEDLATENQNINEKETL